MFQSETISFLRRNYNSQIQKVKTFELKTRGNKRQFLKQMKYELILDMFFRQN